MITLNNMHNTSGQGRASWLTTSPPGPPAVADSPLYSSCLTRVASKDVHVLPHSRHAVAKSCTGRTARRVCISVQLSPSL